MFFKYIKALNLSPVQIARSKYYTFIVIAYVIFIFAVIMIGFNNSALSFFWYFALFFSMGIGVYRRLSPSVLNLLPISTKRRLAYDFCAVLYYFAIMLAVIVVFALIIVGIAFAAVGQEAAVDFQTDFAAYRAARNGTYYDVIFEISFILCIYFGGMAGSYIIRNRNYIIFNIGFLAATMAAIFFTALPYNLAYGFFADDVPMLYTNEIFRVMQYPWLGISLWVIAAVALIGGAIWLGFRYYAVRKR